MNVQEILLYQYQQNQMLYDEIYSEVFLSKCKILVQLHMKYALHQDSM